MPLFGTKNEEPAPVEPEHKSSIFSRNSRNSGDLDRSNTTQSNGTSGKSSFFARRNHSEEEVIGSDPSIKGARQKVKDAEAAERQADQALIAAKNAVRAARDHAQMLEREALEEWVSFSSSCCVVHGTDLFFLVRQGSPCEGEAERGRLGDEEHPWPRKARWLKTSPYPHDRTRFYEPFCTSLTTISFGVSFLYSMLLHTPTVFVLYLGFYTA